MAYPLRWPHLITQHEPNPKPNTHADARRVRLAATILFAVAAEFLLSGLWLE